MKPFDLTKVGEIAMIWVRTYRNQGVGRRQQRIIWGSMHHTEILILGGGLVGLTLALALDKHGISTTIVVDPADPAKTLSDTFDGRASTIASASWRMLEAIEIAERPRPRRVPSGGSGCVTG